MNNIAILTSGLSRGSNFESIANFFKDRDDVNISFVLITRKKAPIIQRCEKFGIPHFFISTKNYELFEENLLKKIKKEKITLIVLAGFMRELSENFIKNSVPIINIHPALLPKFGGKNMFGSAVHKAVFNAKEKESGVTVHLVNDNYDSGKILNQQKVNISDCSNPEEIGKRVLELEHQIYPETIEKICNGEIKLNFQRK